MFEFLNKRYVDVSMVISGKDIFLVFNFKKSRRKFLKGQRLFCARIFHGELSFEVFFSELRNWFETTTEEYILERLEDSPNNARPTFEVSSKIKLDFNVVEEEVAILLPSLYFS